MGYLLLLLLLLLPSCAQPEKPRSVSCQYNQLEDRAAVIQWRLKEVEVQARNDFGTIDRMAAHLDKADKVMKRAEVLRGKHAIAEADYDAAVDNYINAQHDFGGAKLTYQKDLYIVEEMKALLQEAKTFESK